MSEYVLKESTVRECIDVLVGLPIHRHFPGYLCLVREANYRDSSEGLGFDYDEFFDAFFRVSDGENPYFVPFKPTDDPSWRNLQFNSNVAGTYAPSSLRKSSPLHEITTVSGAGYDATWSLCDNHWNVAYEEMCDETPIPVEALAGFLFRDYSFTVNTPGGETLVRAFCEEFRYGRTSRAYRVLFESGEIEITTEDFRQHE